MPNNNICFSIDSVCGVVMVMVMIVLRSMFANFSKVHVFIIHRKAILFADEKQRAIKTSIPFQLEVSSKESVRKKNNVENGRKKSKNEEMSSVDFIWYMHTHSLRKLTGMRSNSHRSPCCAVATVCR